MSGSKNTPENRVYIAKLLDLKKSFYSQISETENELSRLQTKLQDLKDLLMSVCKHEWTYDECCSLYEKPDKICKLCESRIIRF